VESEKLFTSITFQAEYKLVAKSERKSQLTKVTTVFESCRIIKARHESLKQTPQRRSPWALVRFFIVSNNRHSEA
jgi:hypothetical protein